MADHPLPALLARGLRGHRQLRRPGLLRRLHRGQLRGRRRRPRPRPGDAGAELPRTASLGSFLDSRRRGSAILDERRRPCRARATKPSDRTSVSTGATSAGRLARADPVRVGGHEGRPAPVDPGGGQGPARPGAHGQPLVAGPALRVGAWPDDLADACRRARGSRWSSTSSTSASTSGRTDGQRRRVALEPCSVADFYGPRCPRSPRSTCRCASFPDRSRCPTPRRSPEDTEPPALRRRGRPPLLAGAGPGEPGHGRSSAARYHGKVSPVHFFWGAADLAPSRGSRAAAPRGTPAASPTAPTGCRSSPTATRSAAAGSGPAGPTKARSTPTPIRCPTASPTGRSQPAAAYFDQQLGEFILPYRDVRHGRRPRRRAAGLLPEHLRGGCGARRLGQELPRGGGGRPP